MMLARNADSLYWIGRYVERADDIARILDVAVQQMLEDATVDTDSMVRHVMAILGFTPDDKPQSVWSLVDKVGYDRDSTESIVGLIETARENARGAREVISSEMWECLNATYMGLDEAERRARLLGPHAFLAHVKERAAMFAGLTDATLSHDDGYSYLIVGRSIERVDMTVRLLMSRSAYRRDALSWMSLLVAAGGQDTYIRAYRGAVDTENVVEFMMLDRLFPDRCSTRWASPRRTWPNWTTDRTAWDRSPPRSPCWAGRSSIEFIDRAEIVRNLPAYPQDIHATCRAVSESIAEEHFHIEPYVTWTDTGLAYDVAGVRRLAMSARMRLVHSTGFNYSAPVMTSFNEARITPRNDSRQTSVVDHVDTTPGARQFTFTDYWGTRSPSSTCTPPRPARGRRDRRRGDGERGAQRGGLPRSTGSSCATVRSSTNTTRCCSPPSTSPHHPELVEFAAAAAAGLTPAAAAEAVVTGVYDALTYEAGTTEVHSTAIEAWRQRKGVCQTMRTSHWSCCAASASRRATSLATPPAQRRRYR